MSLNFSRKFLLNWAKCVQTTCVRYQSVQGNLMANMLGISWEDAQAYVTRYKLDNVDTIRLANTIKFITSYNFDIEEALEYPTLFKSSEHRLWEQNYLYLKECGFKNVKLTDIISCNKLRILSIKTLKDRKLIPKNINVPERLGTYLNPLPQSLDISDLQDEDLSLAEIHTKIVNRYLKYRLEASDEDLQKIARIHNIYNKSLAYLSENITFALSLGYTNGKILRNAYVLCRPPWISKEVLETVPNFAGSDMRVQLRNYPKLIGISVQKILRIYEILKNENISDEVIKRHMNIFTLSPVTIRTRLNDIKSTPETRVLMSNPRMLSMIIYYHSAKDRLQFLQKVKLRCASLLIIGCQGDQFENHIKEGKDVNKAAEIEDFLRALVKAEKVEQINYKEHPFYLYVPMVDIEDTYFYLKRMSFLNSHIKKVIYILLYPRDKVATVLDKIKLDPKIKDRSRKVSKVQILNLALYLLERDHHFSGNGIWRSNHHDDLL